MLNITKSCSIVQLKYFRFRNTIERIIFPSRDSFPFATNKRKVDTGVARILRFPFVIIFSLKAKSLSRGVTHVDFTRRYYHRRAYGATSGKLRPAGNIAGKNGGQTRPRWRFSAFFRLVEKWPDTREQHSGISCPDKSRIETVIWVSA